MLNKICNVARKTMISLLYRYSRLDNNTSMEDWKHVIVPSNIRTNQHYSFYYLGIAKLIVLGIIPLASLVYLNMKIYNGLKAPPSLYEKKEKNESDAEKDWAKVLIGIVMIFIICHMFRVVIEIDNMVGSAIAEKCYLAGKYSFTLWSIIVDPLSEVMMVLNSATNMLIYTCLSKSFRNYLHFCFFSVSKETKPLQRHHEKQSSEDIPLNCKTESTNMPQSESR